MITLAQVKNKALEFVAWRGSEATVGAMQQMESYRRKGDTEKEEYWSQILDQIRRFEYPIDDEWG